MSSPVQGFIHSFIPAEGDGTGVALLLLHGTGGDERDMLQLGAALAPGAALLAPRGKVLENGAPRFFRRFAEGVFDHEDIRHRSDELAAFIGGATEHYGLPHGGLVAVGYSNGANIASSLMLLHPGVIPAAILLRPMVVLEPEDPPDLRASSVLISAGASDPIVPATHIDRLEAIFKSAGASVEVRRQTASHSLTPQDITDSREWLQRLISRP